MSGFGFVKDGKGHYVHVEPQQQPQSIDSKKEPKKRGSFSSDQK
jgi:hypothetical protein